MLTSQPSRNRALDITESRFGVVGAAGYWITVVFSLTLLASLWLRALGIDPEEDFSPVLLIVAYSPLLAALISVGALRIGFRNYFASLRDGLRIQRESTSWIAAAFFAPLAIVIIGAIAQSLVGDDGSQDWFVWSAIPTGLGAVFAGAIGEELGWRGFGQSLLQNRFTILKASLVIGFVWATWHLWPLLTATTHDSVVIDIANTYVRLMATAVIYAWLFNRKSGLLLVMLAHASHNLAVDMFPVADSQAQQQGTILAVLYLVIAIAVVRDLVGQQHKRDAANA